MNKYRKQIAITLSVIAIIIGILLLIFGKYMFKSKVTVEEFENILGNYPTFSIESFSDNAESDEIKEAIKVVNINDGGIEYYDFYDAKIASQKIDTIKSIITKSFQNDIKTKYFKFNFGKIEYFEIATQTEFVIISKIDNTFIFAYSIIEDEEHIREVLKDIGY